MRRRVSTNAQAMERKTYADAATNSSKCATDADTSVCSPQNDQGWASFIDVFCGTGSP